MRQGVRGVLVVAAGLAVGLVIWLLRPANDSPAPCGEVIASGSPSLDAMLGLPVTDAAATQPAALALAPTPDTTVAALAEAGEPGVPLRLTGRVVDEAHRPIADALVLHWPTKAYREDSDFGRAGDRGAPVPWERLASVRTDATGRFTLPTRDETLDGKLLSYLDSRGVAGGAEPMDARPMLVVEHPQHATTTAFVTTSAAGDVDVGDVVMAGGATIGGRVLEASGAPAEGVRVDVASGGALVENRRRPFAVWSQRLGATTDADGRFRIPGVPVGAYTLFVQAPGAMPEPHPFAVKRPGHQGLGDFTLEAGGRIAGRVLDAQDRPVAWAELRLLPRFGLSGSEGGPDAAALRFGSNVNSNDHPLDAWTRSEEDGSFSVVGRGDWKSYDVLARAEGLDADMARDVTAGRDDVLLRLQPPATWIVRVVDDGDGSPLGSATVKGWRYVDGDDDARSSLKAVREDGAWRLVGASRVRTGIVASAPGHVQQAFELPGLAAGETREQVLRLPRESVLAGHVIDDEGAPLADAHVHLEANSSPADVLDAVDVVADTHGRFRAKGLCAGDWALTAAAATTLPMLEPRVVTLPPGGSVEDIEVVLPRGGTIHGLLLDSDRSPIPRTLIYAQTQSKEAVAAVAAVGLLPGAKPGPGSMLLSSAFTDEDGRFTLAGLAPGHWELTGGDAADGEVDLALRASVEITLARPGPARVRGRVTEGGRPVPGAQVELGFGPDIGSPWMTLASATADEGGNFLIERAASESDFLRAVVGDSPSPPVRVELVAGQEQHVDLVLPTGRVAGRVVAADGGVPLPGIVVRLSDPQKQGGGDPLAIETRSDAEGRFVFESVAAGTWLVAAESPDWCRVRKPDVVVAEGVETPELVLELQRGGTVEVKLDGTAEASVVYLVSLEPLAGTEKPRQNARAGQTARLSPVPPGEYELRVVQRGKSAKGEAFHQRVTVVAGQTLEVVAPLGG